MLKKFHTQYISIHHRAMHTFSNMHCISAYIGKEFWESSFEYVQNWWNSLIKLEQLTLKRCILLIQATHLEYLLDNKLEVQVV
jgi:hypothetical protein